MQGKRVADVTNRMHVALPKPRDGKARPPVIPPSVAVAQVTSLLCASGVVYCLKVYLIVASARLRLSRWFPA